MKRFIEGVERMQSTLFPDRLEDWIGEDNAGGLRQLTSGKRTPVARLSDVS